MARAVVREKVSPENTQESVPPGMCLPACMSMQHMSAMSVEARRGRQMLHFCSYTSDGYGCQQKPKARS